MVFDGQKISSRLKEKGKKLAFFNLQIATVVIYFYYSILFLNAWSWRVSKLKYLLTKCLGKLPFFYFFPCLSCIKSVSGLLFFSLFSFGIRWHYFIDSSSPWIVQFPLFSQIYFSPVSGFLWDLVFHLDYTYLCVGCFFSAFPWLDYIFITCFRPFGLLTISFGARYP